MRLLSKVQRRSEFSERIEYVYRRADHKRSIERFVGAAQCSTSNSADASSSAVREAALASAPVRFAARRPK
jgi:hypothetical protein